MRSPEVLLSCFRASGRPADELPRWLRDMELTSEELTALATWTAFNNRIENADWLRTAVERLIANAPARPLAHSAYVSGGRARHIFLEDAPQPLCGVVPVRAATGLPVVWREGRSGPLRLHHDCVMRARAAGARPRRGGMW